MQQRKTITRKYSQCHITRFDCVGEEQKKKNKTEKKKGGGHLNLCHFFLALTRLYF